MSNDSSIVHCVWCGEPFPQRGNEVYCMLECAEEAESATGLSEQDAEREYMEQAAQDEHDSQVSS